MYRPQKIRNSELLQIIILNNLYNVSGSEHFFFQGGTAIRWIYGGTRFSEDLDFVTHLSAKDIQKNIQSIFKKIHNACVAQFGPGQSEQKQKRSRREAFKIFFIFRPEASRDRIAVKVEFETLKTGQKPETQKVVLRDLSSVTGLLTSGTLIMSYSSSVILVETPEEILADKIRAIYERTYLKGRDIYDIWWLTKQYRIKPSWPVVRTKFEMYNMNFSPARKYNYFHLKKNSHEIISSLENDLPRFIPHEIYSIYYQNSFKEFIETLKDVTTDLAEQGLKKYLDRNE